MHYTHLMVVSRRRLLVLCRARDRLCEEIEVAESAVPIAVLAEEAGLSTGLFIREFTRVFGETPHQRRIRARIERAKHLLARGHSVTEVCFEVGCSSLGSFSALFHRRVGMTPSAYQNQTRSVVRVSAGLVSALHPGCFELMAAAWEVQFRRSAARSHLALSRR